LGVGGGGGGGLGGGGGGGWGGGGGGGGGRCLVGEVHFAGRRAGGVGPSMNTGGKTAISDSNKTAILLRLPNLQMTAISRGDLAKKKKNSNSTNSENCPMGGGRPVSPDRPENNLDAFLQGDISGLCVESKPYSGRDNGDGYRLHSQQGRGNNNNGGGGKRGWGVRWWRG